MMLDRLIVYLLCAMLALAPVAADASQGALSSPTTGTVSGLQLTNTYNNAIDALNTMNSGASAPTNQLSGSPSLGNHFLNTASAPNAVEVHDGTQYLTPWWIDAVNHVPIVQIGGGSANLVSAATTDLCSVPQGSLTITGTTTITSFGSTCVPGQLKVLTFAGALTLTHNPTSLIIPGAASVSPTAAGDIATVMALGSGNWRVISYTPATGQALINPSLDVGDVVYTFLTAPPSSKWLFAFGQAISRTTYSVLLNGVTITQSVTRTSTSPTLTGFTDTSQIPGGAPIEGSGIPTSTTILSCTSTTCTMSANAISSGTANVTIFPAGNGDGSTTFNLPHCDGNVLVGRNNMSGTPSARLSSTYTFNSPNALGAQLGAQSVQLGTGNLPAYTPSGSITNGSITINQTGATQGGTSSGAFASGSFSGPFNNAAISASATQGTSTFAGNAQGGSDTPFGIVPPGLTANCMMRVLN
jgi:hypothetical protein